MGFFRRLWDAMAGDNSTDNRPQNYDNRQQEQASSQNNACSPSLQTEQIQRRYDYITQDRQHQISKLQESTEIQKAEMQNSQQYKYEQLIEQRKREAEERIKAEIEERKKRDLAEQKAYEIRKKKESESRKLQAQIEDESLKARVRAEIYRQNRYNELNSSVGGFKVNSTKISHSSYGNGIFCGFDDKKEYIKIKFMSQPEILTFTFPEGFDQHLSIVGFSQSASHHSALSTKSRLSTSFNKTIQHRRAEHASNPTRSVTGNTSVVQSPASHLDYQFEKQYFSSVCSTVENKLERSREEERSMRFGYNDFSDSYDSSILSLHQDSYEVLERWREIRNNPYFARVIHGNNSSFYIGKNAVDGFVTDWRDKKCSMYYQYEAFVGVEEYNLTLIRDFEIRTGILIGFGDRLNRHTGISTHSYQAAKVNVLPSDISIHEIITADSGESNINGHSDKTILSDDFLTKIIESNRSNKTTTDIIQTIQENQYKIITHKHLDSLVVQGCAGSGKTMIMLHRLSYMVFNHSEINLNDFYIISPTNLLNLENNELAATLNINQANRFAGTGFYKRLIEKYCKNNGLISPYGKCTIKSNTHVDSNIIRNVYSDSFRESFRRAVSDILIQSSQRRQEFVEEEKNSLLSEFGNFFRQKITIHSFDEAYAKTAELKKALDKAKEITAKLPYKNAIAKIDTYFDSKGLSNKVDSTIDGKRNLLENVIANWEMSERPRYTDKGTLSINDNLFNNVFSYFDVMGKSNMNNKHILKNRFPYLKHKYEDTWHLLSSFSKLIDRTERFNKFVENGDKEYIDWIILHLIADFKQKNGLDLGTVYEFELYLFLTGIQLVYGGLQRSQSFVFIDEFQDYSISEIILFKGVFPQAVFNLFGDLKQNINAKGLNKGDLNRIAERKWGSFEINENYRNAHQITEYVNATFKINMRPIGINGSVKGIYIDKLMTFAKMDKMDRYAFVVKDISLFEELNSAKRLFPAHVNLNIVNDDDGEIIRGVINVLPVSLVKGLEFEQVLVLTKNMTENERYVSYTRALRNLFIVSGA